VDAKRQRNRGRRTAQVAQQAEVQIEPRIGRKKRAQAGDRLSGRNHQREVARGMAIVLLETAKEKSLVFADGPTYGEPVHVVTENRLGSSVQLVEIGHRIEPVRLVAP